MSNQISEKIVISQVTSQDLKNRKYIDVFPEYYKSANITENNGGHDHQNGLDHVIGVYAGLETILQFKDVSRSQRSQLETYLSQPIGSKTRRELLMIATLLHDIAKPDTLVLAADGTTSCPGHELIGAGRVAQFSSRFNLDQQDEQHVERIVQYHGLIFNLLTIIAANGHREKYFDIFQNTVGDIALELVLFIQADLLGGDMDKLKPETFNQIAETLTWMQEELIFRTI